MTLTAKQEAFAQAVADGMTQADAYRTAFNAAKMKAETIHKRASELMADGGAVAGRVAKLRSKLATKALWTREQSVQALARAIEIAEGKDNAAWLVGAIKELNAMHGHNAPVKHEITGAEGAPLFDASKLSTAALAEILAAKNAK